MDKIDRIIRNSIKKVLKEAENYGLPEDTYYISVSSRTVYGLFPHVTFYYFNNGMLREVIGLDDEGVYIGEGEYTSRREFIEECDDEGWQIYEMDGFSYIKVRKMMGMIGTISKARGLDFDGIVELCNKNESLVNLVNSFINEDNLI